MWKLKFCTLLHILLAVGLSCSVIGPAYAQLAEGWDFIPGEKLLLYDDFTDLPKGGSPPHWKVRGASVKLDASGRLLVSEETNLFPNVTAWPKNFTVEQEFIIRKSENSDVAWAFSDKQGDSLYRMWLRFFAEGECGATLEGPGGELGGAKCKYADGEPNKLGLWVQDGRIRFYWNSERLIDVNQVSAPAPATASFETDMSEGAVLAMVSTRIAEASPDFGKTILASGRFVSHGVHFDVNSDRLRPESAPVLKMVADALAAQPSLKLRIEGHTDSTGDPAKNLDLSRRRAESVRNSLATQFKIDPARLTTEGLGQNKPLSGNDTPSGRANNRRVEFVRM